MKIKQKAGLAACLFCALIAASACSEPEPKSASGGELVTFQEPHMGTLFTIRVWVPKSGSYPVPSGTVQGTVDDCTLYSRKAFQRVAELNQIFSDYLVDSELSKLSQAPANQPVPVSDELLDVLIRGRELAEATDGAFDVTIGPMIRLWRRARKSRQLPTEAQILGAKARTGFEKLIIDRDAKTVTKLVDQMVLDLGGIAKGYAADTALKIMKDGGFSRCLVAASGDIALGDPPPGKEGWAVGLDTLEMAEPGEASFTLANAAVSTSGDTQRFLIIEGKRYSHIVDKHTGLGLTARIAVSVIAPDATTSDSYATAVSILGKERGMALIESTDGLECRIVTVDDSGEAKVWLSSGYPAK